MHLLKDLLIKYKDGKLTTIELTELIPFISDLAEFVKDLATMKSLYKALKPDQKALLHKSLATELSVDPGKIESMIDQFFSLLTSFALLETILFADVPTSPVATNNDATEV